MNVELPARVELVTFSVPAVWIAPPPETVGEFPTALFVANVLSVTVSEPQLPGRLMPAP